MTICLINVIIRLTKTQGENKMKKVLSFILGLFLGCLPFSNTAMAIPIPGRTTQMTSQEFANHLLENARRLIDAPEWRELQGDSERWAREAAEMARLAGIECDLYIVSFQNRTSRCAIKIFEGTRTYICDYYKILQELSEKHLPDLTRPWNLMEYDEHNAENSAYIRAMEAEHGEFYTIFTIPYRNLVPNA